MTTTEAQIKAMQASFLPGNLDADEAREAIDAAREALEQGLLPLLALNAACSKLYAGFAVMSMEARGVLMVEALNGLMAADVVERIGPKGVLPIQVIRTKSSKRR
jgi:hypothetical protein